MKRWGIDEWVNKNRRVSCQRKRCLHNIWKFRSHSLGESWTRESSQEMRGRAKRKGQSGCTPAEGSWKIRRICGSHSQQGGNWSRWISGILLPSLRRHRRSRLPRLRLRFSVSLFQKLFLIYSWITRRAPCRIKGRRSAQNIPAKKLSVRHHGNPMLSGPGSWRD